MPCRQLHKVHNEREVEAHLPERERPWVRTKLRAAFKNLSVPNIHAARSSDQLVLVNEAAKDLGSS